MTRGTRAATIAGVSLSFAAAPDVAAPPRPALHFTPPLHWANDPNGLLRIDNRWRLWFQYAADAPDYRRVQWGTASSPDLLHWRFDGVALAPEPGTDAYSGSVLDVATAGGPQLHAFYTANRGTEPRRQTQRLALGTPDGARLVPAPGGPLLDEGLPDFRDPFVCAAPGGGYAMLVAKPVPWQEPRGGARSCIALYRSEDLHRWRPTAEFGPADGEAVLWEVPWLAPIACPDGVERWVLAVSVVDRSGGQTRCATCAWLGTFDGESFVADPGTPPLPLDHGPDYYAPIPAASRDRADRATTIAWLSNWAYARRLPFGGWAGGPMSLPRELQVVRRGDAWTFAQRPAADLTMLRHDTRRLPAVMLGGDDAATFELPACACEIEVEIAHEDAGTVVLALGDGHLVLRSVGGRHYELERSCGAVDAADFAGRWSAARCPASPVVRARLIVDGCTCEVFLDDGTITFSALVFPCEATARLRASATGGSARVAFVVHALRPERAP